MDDDLDTALTAVGPRLRALRQQRETTLADLSATTGISVSTLSRLESGRRKPTLELLLPLARALKSTDDRRSRPQTAAHNQHEHQRALPCQHPDSIFRMVDLRCVWRHATIGLQAATRMHIDYRTSVWP